jgi:hypothetical protein
VWSAPVGTTSPDGLGDLDPAFDDAGFLSEDGVEMEASSETVEVRVHQGYRIARTKITGTKHTFKFVCSETNAVSLGLMNPASTFTTSGDVTTISDQEKTKRDERVFVIDEFDDDIHKRVVYTRAEITERGVIAHKANEATVYEFTGTSYGPIYTLTNDPALAVAVA